MRFAHTLVGLHNLLVHQAASDKGAPLCGLLQLAACLMQLGQQLLPLPPPLLCILSQPVLARLQLFP